MAIKDLLLLMRFEGIQLTLDAAYLFKKATGRSEEFGRLVLCRCFVLVRMLECLLKQKLFSNLRIFNLEKLRVSYFCVNTHTHTHTISRLNALIKSVVCDFFIICQSKLTYCKFCGHKLHYLCPKNVIVKNFVFINFLC